MPRKPKAVPLAPPTAAERGAWWLAVGAAAVAQLDPSLLEVAELSMLVAGATTQAAARESLLQLRAKAGAVARGLPPVSARALLRVVRGAERASGRVAEKKARVHELQGRWHDLVTCLRLARA